MNIYIFSGVEQASPESRECAPNDEQRDNHFDYFGFHQHSHRLKKHFLIEAAIITIIENL